MLHVGAPGTSIFGGNGLWGTTHGDIALRWLDGTLADFRLRIGGLRSPPGSEIVTWIPGSEPDGPGIYTFQPASLGSLCPALSVTGTDADFDGHGPTVLSNVELSISEDRKSIHANIEFTAIEDRRLRWSELPADRREVYLFMIAAFGAENVPGGLPGTIASGAWVREVWRAPDSLEIESIRSALSSSTEGVSVSPSPVDIAPVNR